MTARSTVPCGTDNARPISARVRPSAPPRSRSNVSTRSAVVQVHVAVLVALELGDHEAAGRLDRQHVQPVLGRDAVDAAPGVVLDGDHQQVLAEHLGMGDDPLLQMRPLPQPLLAEADALQRSGVGAGGREQLHVRNVRLGRVAAELLRRGPEDTRASAGAAPSSVGLAAQARCRSVCTDRNTGGG